MPVGWSAFERITAGSPAACHEFELDFGELPLEFGALVSLTGVRGLMGMELLERGRLGFDLASGTIVFDPSLLGREISVQTARA